MPVQIPTPPPATPPPASPTPALGRGWLRDVIRGIRQDGVQPRDPRVKALWAVLRRRQLLARDPWVRSRLRLIWQKGLSARHRPRTTQRILALLRSRNVVSLPRRPPVGPSHITTPARPFRTLRPVVLRRVATLRPVGRPRPVQPVQRLAVRTHSRQRAR